MSAALLAACADHYCVLVSDMMGPTRRHAVAHARAAACYVLNRRDGYGYLRIAGILERGDHSSVRYSIAAAEKRLRTDPDMAELVDSLMALPAQTAPEQGRKRAELKQFDLDWSDAAARKQKLSQRFPAELTVNRKPKNELDLDDTDALMRHRGTNKLLAAMQREGVLAA